MMKVITVITDKQDPGFSLLRLSCAVNRLELVVLMHDQGSQEGSRVRDDLLRAWLADNAEDNEVLLFTDGNDTIFLSAEEEVLMKYARAKKDILFSGESGCWPDPGLADQYPAAGSGAYRYLNSGGFIGKAGVIRKLLEEEVPGGDRFNQSSQYLWTRRYFRHPDQIGIDTACNLFCTFSPELGQALVDDNNIFPYYFFMKDWFDSNFVIQKGRIFSSITGTSPCHCHFNGYARVLMDADIIDLIFGNIPGVKKATFVPDPHAINHQKTTKYSNL